MGFESVVSARQGIERLTSREVSSVTFGLMEQMQSLDAAIDEAGQTVSLYFEDHDGVDQVMQHLAEAHAACRQIVALYDAAMGAAAASLQALAG